MPPELNKYYFAKGWLGINLIISLIVFAVVIFIAPFVTIVFSVTIENWFWLFITRILLFSLPVIWFSISVGFYLAIFLAPTKKIFWSTCGFLLAVTISIFFCWRLISDLFSGPVDLHGQVTDSEVIRIENGIFYHYIESLVNFRTDNGKEYVFKAVGNHAVKWERFLQSIEENKTIVDIEVLPNTGFLLKSN